MSGIKNKLWFISILFYMSVFYSQLTLAGSVEMLESPQTAEEMGKALFTQPSTSSKPKFRTRGISFGVDPKAAEPKEEKVESQPKTLGLPIKCAINSANILPESIPFVQEVGKMLTLPEYQNEKIMIEGHTDASGSFDKNLILSYRRAEAIKDYLMKNYNVSASRLSTDGRGEKEPLPNTDPNSAVNRRVQLYRQ